MTAHEATPHGGGGGVDQTARDAAATAQGEIDATREPASTTPTRAPVKARPMLRRPSRNTYPLIPFTGYQPLRRGYWHLRTLHRQAAGLPCSLTEPLTPAPTWGRSPAMLSAQRLETWNYSSSSTSGDRPGWTGYVKLPAADLYAATGASGTAIANTVDRQGFVAVGSQQRRMAFAADCYEPLHSLRSADRRHIQDPHPSPRVRGNYVAIPKS